MIKRNIINIVFICSLFSSNVYSDNEDYPVINSNAILTSEYLSSTYHRIDSIDISDDFYHFIVDSDIGRY